MSSAYPRAIYPQRKQAPANGRVLSHSEIHLKLKMRMIISPSIGLTRRSRHWLLTLIRVFCDGFENDVASLEYSNAFCSAFQVAEYETCALLWKMRSRLLFCHRQKTLPSHPPPPPPSPPPPPTPLHAPIESIQL